MRISAITLLITVRHPRSKKSLAKEHVAEDARRLCMQT